MLAWPLKARRAISSFFVKWNDIDVYVEDTAKHAESLYTALINNALAGSGKVQNVFPLGGRAEVIQQCMNDQGSSKRARIYLIDGDLDLLAGIPSPAIPRLYRHKVYAIENYLFCESAIVEILHEEYPDKKPSAIKRSFDHNKFLKGIAPLTELFVWFALTRALDPSLPTIKLGLGRFLDGKKIPWIDAAKVTAFCQTRRADLLRKSSIPQLEEEEKKVRHRLTTFPSLINPIAAREFLFPLVRFHAQRRKLSMSIRDEALYMRLAKCVDFKAHKLFVSALRSETKAILGNVERIIQRKSRIRSEN